MNFTETKTLTKKQKHQIFDLWNKEYPKKLSHSDLTGFEEYLQNLTNKNHIILSDEDDIVKGWFIYFIRDEERCFAMILDESIQGKGWGSKFLDRAKEYNMELNGWVIDHNTELKPNGEPYISPVGFYKKNGFQIVSEALLIKEGIKGIKVIWRNNN